MRPQPHGIPPLSVTSLETVDQRKAEERDREDQFWRERIQWRVRELARAKGIPSALQLSERIKLNKNSANNLWNGTALRIDRDTLAKLCDALECAPGDLLVLVGEPRHEERA
ncbi:MAG: helix-turn-helix transcriptional regulator [Chloroflexales bacterium]